jgi:murein DD-endopeptidase MepM/ murein hydrolase activator NlpD
MVSWAFDLGLPTANDAVLRPGHDAEFFQPTVEGTVASGMFGCVRRGGARFHEGVDIKCLQRDRQGESTDPVHAISGGTVAFINDKPGLSNYGRYIVLEHRWDGVQVFSLYAHLRAVEPGLAAGQPVRKAQRIGTLGRSANTREGIPRDRAHLHLEIDFLLNTNFRIWYPRRDPKAPPFGNFNGKNLIGLDPVALFRAYAADPKLNFAAYVARQPLAFTVLVGGKPLPWYALHPEQMQPGPTPATYEIGFTSWGVPVAVWPRQEALPAGRPVLHRVSEPELARASCRGLVERRGKGWQLSDHGRELLDLLTFTP